MTRDESDQIEELLMTWYRWAKAYRPALGAPRVSPYGRGAEGDGYGDPAEAVDERIEAAQAETVDACLNDLPWQQRSAVGIHTANRAAGNEVYRNPRMSRDEAHAQYQAAKAALLPMLCRKGLIVRDSASYSGYARRIYGG